MTTGEGPVTYPVAVIKVNKLLYTVLLDKGAGSSFASPTLLQELNITPRNETKTVEMMLHTATKKIEIFESQIQNVTSNFNFITEVSKLEKDILINIPEPQYKAMINQFQHLKDIQMNDIDTKSPLRVHENLRASEYSKIKVQQYSRIGQQG